MRLRFSLLLLLLALTPGKAESVNQEKAFPGCDELAARLAVGETNPLHAKGGNYGARVAALVLSSAKQPDSFRETAKKFIQLRRQVSQDALLPLKQSPKGAGKTSYEVLEENIAFVAEIRRRKTNGERPTKPTPFRTSILDYSDEQLQRGVIETRALYGDLLLHEDAVTQLSRRPEDPVRGQGIATTVMPNYPQYRGLYDALEVTYKQKRKEKALHKTELGFEYWQVKMPIPGPVKSEGAAPQLIFEVYRYQPEGSEEIHFDISPLREGRDQVEAYLDKLWQVALHDPDRQRAAEAIADFEWLFMASNLPGRSGAGVGDALTQVLLIHRQFPQRQAFAHVDWEVLASPSWETYRAKRLRELLPSK